MRVFLCISACEVGGSRISSVCNFTGSACVRVFLCDCACRGLGRGQEDKFGEAMTQV